MQYFNPSKVEESKAVTLADAKEQLNILTGETTDDAFITKLIDRATGISERFIEKDINEKTCTVIIDASSTIHLEDGYIKSITSIVDDQAAAVAHDNIQYWSDYTLVDTEQTTGKITVIYKTGWVAADLPEEIRAAILLKVGNLYDVDRNNSTMGNIKSTEQFEDTLRYHKKLRL